ncbi:snRNA-activating protein complex subunit 5-like [Haliotis rubra]|uniref:snRNA-activating protein complex subunit 5-like n=1 Tax=Haliotis rubra TaxID=36100 RepID=UPI001EE5BF9E|nr:snRNA-activating protein complex subunit 5-like [Haliotis rubra]
MSYPEKVTSGEVDKMSHKEQQMLKEEERSLVNLHTKLSDQLNRLKVEELALISMLRLQNRPTSTTMSQHTDQTDEGPVRQEIQSELTQLEEKYQEALDLSVAGHLGMSDYHEEEEEEDEDDEDDDEPETVTDQLSAFLDELSARNK